MREFIDSLIRSSGIYSDMKVEVDDYTGLENIRRIRPNQYVVWTQAGFKKACREVVNKCERDLGRNFRKYVQGYPQSYPSLVVFHDSFNGRFTYWIASCTPIDKAVQKYKSEIEMLENINKEHQAKIDNLKGKSQNGDTPV